MLQRITVDRVHLIRIYFPQMLYSPTNLDYIPSFPRPYLSVLLVMQKVGNYCYRPVFTSCKQFLINSYFFICSIVFYGLLNEPFQEVLRKKVGCVFPKSVSNRSQHSAINNIRPPISQISNLPPLSPVSGPSPTLPQV